MRSCWMQNLGLGFWQETVGHEEGQKAPSLFPVSAFWRLAGRSWRAPGPKANSNTLQLLFCHAPGQWLCCEEGARSGFLLNTMASQIPNSLYLVMICGVNIQVTEFLGPSDDRNMEDLDCVLSRGTVNLSSWLHLYTGIWNHTETGWLRRLNGRIHQKHSDISAVS